MPQPRSLGSSEASLYRQQVQLAGRFAATLQNRFRAPTDSDLRARIGLLAISARNPRFSNALVEAFCRTARERLAGGLVTVVDRPYERNIAAGCGTSEEQLQEIEILRRVATETLVRVGRIIAKAGGAISIKPWDELAAETPGWLTQSIRTAWEKRGRFYADVLAQTGTVIPTKPAPDALERYAEFLLEELPVLLHCYYFRPEEVVDVYPGPQPVLFWRIEAGAYADEMPVLAHRLRQRAGVVYAHVWARIRIMRPAELKAVVRIWRRSHEQAQPWLKDGMNGTREEDEGRFLDSVGRQNEVWLAAEDTEDGRVLGFLAIRGSQVNHVYVDPPVRRRGVGTALLERAKALSPRGVTVFAHERNEVARAFCIRHGFREVRPLVKSLPECRQETEFAWKPPDNAADPPSPTV